ncbi:MAG: hypothetical protein ACI965_000126 [Paraglaciecola sp.]|jgi:hypothetical protein
MKNNSIIGWLALLVLVPAGQVSAQSWSAKSIEKHRGNTSEVMTKSSQGVKLLIAPLVKTAQDKDSASGKKASPAQAQSGMTLLARPQVQALDHEFWIYDAQVSLYSDPDFDGYYHHFSVEFDADTVFEHADVYARLYLGRGEVFQEFHTSSVFHIDGESSDDSFEVDSELLTGFPSGDYELLIELYDALNDELVATLDGNSDADLYSLALESADFEEVYGEPMVVIVHENGGSMAYLTLLLLPLALYRKRGVFNKDNKVYVPLLFLRSVSSIT